MAKIMLITYITNRENEKKIIKIEAHSRFQSPNKI